MAITEGGVFLRAPGGIEAIPLGTFFVEIHPSLFVPAGYEVMPAVSPDVLHRTLGSPVGKVLFLAATGRTIGVAEDAFVPLETAILEAPAWEPAIALEIERTLEEATIDLQPGPLGAFPLSGVEPPVEEQG